MNLGLKIVRGAYILEETRIANQQGYANPIYHSYSDTNNNYNEGVDYLIESCTEKDRIIFATHNKESIKILYEKLLKSGKISYKNICSAQLLGMGEETSFVSKDTYVSLFLMKKKIDTYKYLPYGEFSHLLPYLFRRAEESSLLSNVNSQNKLINEELKFRFLSKLKYNV